MIDTEKGSKPRTKILKTCTPSTIVVAKIRKGCYMGLVIKHTIHKKETQGHVPQIWAPW